MSDLDNDGDPDIIAGNLGLNNKFHPSEKKPLEIYMNDFDNNGTNDIVLAKHSKNECLPVRGRECSSGQMPFLSQKFPTYKAFANADVTTMYGQDKLDNSVHLQANEFQSMVLINENGKFRFQPLPNRAQVAPINGIEIQDVNGDGHKDLVVAGNMFGAEVETSRYDAGIGCVLLGDGAMNFAPQMVLESGFFADHNAKGTAQITLEDGGKAVIVANSNGPIQVFRISTSDQPN